MRTFSRSGISSYRAVPQGSKNTLNSCSRSQKDWARMPRLPWEVSPRTTLIWSPFLM